MKYASIILMLFSSAIFAQTQYTINVPSNLTETQIAELQSSANNMVANAAHTSMPKSIAEWKEISEILSDSLISTAQKLGITVNEFASTGVGKLLTIVLLWNYLGESLIHLIFGFFWFVTLIPIWLYMYKNYCFETKTKIFTEDGKTLLRVDVDSVSDDQKLMYWITLVVILAVGTVIVFTG